MKQIFNPYMPSYEYVPDGEPHIFDDRLYIYGSHDRFDGQNFCLNNYVCYSAPVNDLTSWRYDGVIYRKEQDPRNQHILKHLLSHTEKRSLKQNEMFVEKEHLYSQYLHAMYAPDVVRGANGMYYLYYCLDCLNGIGVAQSNDPIGPFSFLGFVRHADGIMLGDKEGDCLQFDPAVFIDDDGGIYLYSGNAPRKKKTAKPMRGSQVMTLCDDMLTLRTEPKELLPSVYESIGTGYEGHEFFEASSLRKINSKYYFIYSSVQSHELCYAVSNKPDEEFEYGGTLVDIGDVFLDGRTENEALNCLGNTHGSIECCNGQWYIFYHRHTNRTQFCRQACAEKIFIDQTGHIAQAEITSCGLNVGALNGRGQYPAYIACHLTLRGKNVFSSPSHMGQEYPFITQDMKDTEPCSIPEGQMPVQYVHNIRSGACIGYKYFSFHKQKRISVRIRGCANGFFHVKTDETRLACGKIPINVDSAQWIDSGAKLQLPDGTHALYLQYEGEGVLDLLEFTLD